MQESKKYLKYLLVFFAGILLTYFLLNWTKRDTQSEASHTIAYGIKRLNKMVVAEQNYTNFYSHKSSTQLLGDYLSFDKNLLLKVDIKTQASYDLSQMNVEVDSVNERIIIHSIPELKVESFPDVNFFEMNQSMLNQFSSKDLNGIKARAIKEVQKTVDDEKLQKQAKEQLINNLEEIYLLAKIYGWEVVDSTAYREELKERVKF